MNAEQKPNSGFETGTTDNCAPKESSGVVEANVCYAPAAHPFLIRGGTQAGQMLPAIAQSLHEHADARRIFVTLHNNLPIGTFMLLAAMMLRGIADGGQTSQGYYNTLARELNKTGN